MRPRHPDIHASAVLVVALAMVFASCGEKKAPAEAKEPAAAAEEAADEAAAAKKAADEAAAAKKAKAAEVEKMFAASLHKTGGGMKYWYDKGSKAVIGKEYADLDCKNCHVKGCDACHCDGEAYEAEVSKDACLKCHTRYKTTVALDEMAGIVDPHAKMSCTKCHPKSDMHGDGKEYASMRDRDFLKADCLDCHAKGKLGAKKFDASLDSHSTHENLTCIACHASNTVACLNCHFDTFLATGSRKGNFVNGKNWLLLVNYQGKVTSGTMMSIVSGDQKYATFAPYATHSITEKGRACGDCHATDTVKALADGKTVRVAEFEGGEMKLAEGVIPVVDGKVDVPYLDKNEAGEWVELESKKKPVVTYSGYAEPITAEQLEKLKEKVD